ncbi:MAG: hypothetical protein HRU38_03920 [Saccharospirillaceae bacterium]|nr:hypothetical protein [Pseudomonadales bacterium]NRB77812.1 hypothetical protein [Saccharospirillaceae bacterium]
MKSLLLTCLLSVLSCLSLAQDNQVDDYLNNSKYSINTTISPVNFPLPLAFGISAYYKVDNNWSVGVDYLRSNLKIAFFGFDIGESTQSSYTLQVKRYYGQSFNVKMGLGTRNTQVLFGKSLIDLASANYQETAAEFNAKYIRIGLGNVWHFKKQFTAEVDWLTIDIPVNAQVVTSAAQYAQSEDGAQTIKSAESIIKYFPSGSILKINLGIVF